MFKKIFLMSNKLKRHFFNLVYSYLDYHYHSAFKIKWVSRIGGFAFPLYFIIWSYILPQPYENLTLRLIGTCACLAIGLPDYWPKKLQSWLPLASYVTLLYSLPFFFSFMCLMNDANLVWQLSAMSSIVYTAFLYDIKNVIITTFMGVLSAIICYFIYMGTTTLPPDYWYAIPVYLFTLFGVLLLDHSDTRIGQEKLGAAESLVSQIAHEMRTPLLGIKLDTEKIQKTLPDILETYHWALENGWEGPRMNSRKIKNLQTSLMRANDHTKSAGLVIDMLLMNVRSDEIKTNNFTHHKMLTVVKEALHRYHFRTAEVSLVKIAPESADFQFYGSDLLMQHVLFNLLKNALRAFEAHGSGDIVVSTHIGKKRNLLIFADTGPGIPANVLPYIFMPFYSGVNYGRGSGVGLAFCQQVLQACGGLIECQSSPAGTIFKMSFPKDKYETHILS